MSQDQLTAIDVALRSGPREPRPSRSSAPATSSSPPARSSRTSRSRDVLLGGVPALRLEPPDATGAALLYLHGGGYVIGSARSGAGLAAALARRTSAVAYSLDYRLAPEHPFPAAVQDGLAAYRALLDAGHEPERLVVAGDSAGGGLALALLAGRPRGGPAAARSGRRHVTVGRPDAGGGEPARQGGGRRDLRRGGRRRVRVPSTSAGTTPRTRRSALSWPT